MAQSGWSKSKLLNTVNQPDTNDTTLINCYNELAWPVYSYTQTDSSIYFAKLALALSAKLNDMYRMSIAHRRLGITYSNTGALRLAVLHEERSYKLSDSLNFDRGKFLATNNIGVAYLNSELFDKALPFFLKTLPYLEQNKLYGDLLKVYINCGIINRKLNNVPKEKYFFINANKAAQLTHDSDAYVITNSYLCATYRRLGQTDSANYFLNKASRYISDQTAGYVVYNYYLNAAQLAAQQRNHKKALDLLEKSMPFSAGLSDEITLLINFGEQYVHLKDFGKALQYYKSAYEKSERNNLYDNLQYISAAMASVYEQQHRVADYAAMMKKYVQHRDSNEKINRAQEILSKQVRFDIERQRVADSVRYEQREKMTNLELEMAETRLANERYTRFFLVGGLALLIGIAIFISNRLRITKRQKHIIELQKKLVETKNTELMDSINYARRLQLAILPQLDIIKRHLHLELFYQPKEVIGGDFYFFDHYNGRSFFAVCDCTGHGVPGAIMSVVCHAAIQESIRVQGITDPAEILEHSRNQIIKSLNAQEQNIRDGMDCSMLVIDTTTRLANWAGANHHLWLFTENTFSELKGVKQSVSFHEQPKPFISHTFELPHNMQLCLFTDGYYDQFGGPGNKKLMYRNFQKQMFGIVAQPAANQVEALRSAFTNWKQSNEQIDDVTVAIIRV